ncbi:MAG: DUF692 domain-containing protein [Alphaproteobacteria bacterium]|nr:DUF692 domain-containing protein [Alphaproteobacteria bacterium]
MGNRFGLPYLGFGLGLRAPHYDDALRQEHLPVDWFEIISENFIEAHPGYWEFLQDVRRRHPLVMHGVSLSIGSVDPLNADYLAKLKKLAEAIRAAWVSDHLCWTGVHGRNTHDLLPVPYSEEALRHIAGRVRQVQEALGRPLVLENPSSYVEFTTSSMPEWEFLGRLAELTGCGLLLDVNNVYVSAFNHGFDARRYIDAIPADRIVQIHLAGHQHHGTHIIDTHDREVIGEVWALYAYTLQRKGEISTMVEWDEHIPELSVLLAELEKARQAAGAARKAAA